MTLLASALILFLLFGSVVIPIKAVIMTLLSITASFGALVWIFQDGNLSNLLNFEPLGYTIAGNPIIMFSVIFGLSMDYEVLLLSRIQEAYRRTGENTMSVAEGLSKTAGVITGAALIMVSVFAAFALAEVITIKSIGVGMAIAVAVDATIIRVLLVPATMRLMGKWNWWAPGILGRFVDKLGFSHVEDEEEPAAGARARDLRTEAGRRARLRSPVLPVLPLDAGRLEVAVHGRPDGREERVGAQRVEQAVALQQVLGRVLELGEAQADVVTLERRDELGQHVGRRHVDLGDRLRRDDDPARRGRRRRHRGLDLLAEELGVREEQRARPSGTGPGRRSGGRPGSG